MNQQAVKRHLRHFIALLSLIAMVVTVFLVTSPSIASAHTLAPAAVPTPCRHVLNGNYSENCVLPVITTSPQSQCPGTQYWGTTDSYHIPVNYTLTDEGNTCVTVTYNFNSSFPSCDASFYIPAGQIATATFSYHWHDAGGDQGGGTVNEDTSIAGWQQLFSSSGATTLTFNDHDTPGGKNLSWGSSAPYSLEVFCS